MPESSHEIRRALERLQRLFRVRAVADAISVAAVAAGAVCVVVAPVAELKLRATYPTVIFVATAVVAGARWWRRWTLPRVARAIEARAGDLDNLLVTSEEALRGRTLHPILARELFEQTARRLRTIEARPGYPRVLGRGAIALAMSVAVAVLVLSRPDMVSIRSLSAVLGEALGQADGGAGTLRVTVIPPAYTRTPERTVDNVPRVDVLEGSRVRLEFIGAQDEVELIEPGRAPARFARVDGTARLELVATASRVLLIRQPALAGEGTDRLLHLNVQPDQRPNVAIEQPARDLWFATPRGRVAVRVVARDDAGLASVVLRYTRIAGSGETFTFEEGEVPLTVQSASRVQGDKSAENASAAASGTEWRGDGAIVLENMTLEDGDTLIYRALARDHKPGADPSASDTFLIEIGKHSEATSAGFALPEERDRQALSQQMLIMKTERLIAERPTLSPETALERSRLLAIEQRMVRAEFIFMSGGEVQDEVEEAEQSHELVEGRLENEGQAALLAAVREMSRAEARLNAGDTTPALGFERAALAALQRAFDRRRYFLRTLPERARIDPARRLSGDVATARSSTRSLPPAVEDPAVASLRQLVRDLAAAAHSRIGLDARMAARVLAADAQSSALQAAAVVISGGARLDDRVKAALEAQAPLEAMLRRHLAVAADRRPPRDPLLGHLADRLPQERPR